MNDNTRKKFVVWAAVSSLPQAKKISLDDQIDEAQRHVDRFNGQIVAVLRVPGKSRSIVLFEDACSKIDAYAELRELIQRRAFDVLIYLDRSRLGRKASLSMAVVELCHDAGIVTYEMESPPSSLNLAESHDEMLIGAIKSVGAQQEIRKLVDRHRKGMLGRAQAGKFPNQLPYGYKRVFAPDGTERVEIDDGEAAQLRTALLELYVGDGLTQQQVADEMTRRGFVYRTGKPWAQAHMMTILRAVWQAAGKVVLNRTSQTNRPYTITEGAHPPILTEEEAQAIFDEQRRRTNNRNRPRSPRLFSGVLRCGVCGEPMHVHDTGKSYSRSYVCKYNFCAGGRVQEERVIEWMELAIESLANVADRDAVLADNATDDAVETISRVEGIKRRIDDNTASYGRLVRLYVDLGAITEPEFMAQRERLESDRAKMESELDRLRAEIENVEHAAGLGDRLEEIAAIGFDRLHDPDERQANLWLRRHFVITIADYDVAKIEYL